MEKLSELIPDEKRKTIHYVLLSLAVFAVTYVVYRGYAYLMGRTIAELPYWNLLAKAFLEGKLYLTNPSATWDLTFSGGHWYVPEPPLPAILMLPGELFSGDVNSVPFSIFFSAINSMLVFMILERLSRLGWINMSRSAMLWLVVLFAFGTPHWWMGMDGKVWYVSQIVAVTFIALAALLALKSWSPWLAGLCLGLAIWSRPNAIVIWPFLFAITVQILKDENKKVEARPLVNWAIKSVIPIGLAVVGLLVYNYLRFHNFFDFGYATINGDPVLVEAAQKYGLFSIHFIPQNLYTMFLKLPAIQPKKPYLDSTITGMSMFITTPAFLYLIRRYEKKLWIFGAWGSTFLSLVMLSMYHNPGWAQFGYRYILDFIVPLMCLLATTVKRKISLPFLLLILISVVINEYGAYWFIRYFSG